MNKEQILYNNLKIISYELATKTLIQENHNVCTYYYVKWNTKLDGVIEQEITEEEYKILEKELSYKCGAYLTNAMFVGK